MLEKSSWGMGLNNLQEINGFWGELCIEAVGKERVLLFEKLKNYLKDASLENCEETNNYFKVLLSVNEKKQINNILSEKGRK